MVSAKNRCRVMPAMALALIRQCLSGQYGDTNGGVGLTSPREAFVGETIT